MLLRNSSSNIRNIRHAFQLIEYQYILANKERLGQNKEHSILIKLNS